MKLKILWRLITRLPELFEFYEKYKPVITQFEEATAQFREVTKELSDNLDLVSKAAQMVSDGYVQAVQMSTQYSLLGQPSSDKLDEEIEKVKSAITAMTASPAIGSREINSRSETLMTMQSRMDELLRKQQELKNNVGARG